MRVAELEDTWKPHASNTQWKNCCLASRHCLPLLHNGMVNVCGMALKQENNLTLMTYRPTNDKKVLTKAYSDSWNNVDCACGSDCKNSYKRSLMVNDHPGRNRKGNTS